VTRRAGELKLEKWLYGRGSGARSCLVARE
jgi:hypothetical protein